MNGIVGPAEEEYEARFPGEVQTPVKENSLERDVLLEKQSETSETISVGLFPVSAYREMEFYKQVLDFDVTSSDIMFMRYTGRV